MSQIIKFLCNISQSVCLIVLGVVICWSFTKVYNKIDQLENRIEVLERNTTK